MPLPTEPVTLSVAQIEDLNRKLADFRHDLNNNLSLMVAAMEMIQRRPETAPRMWPTLMGQPKKIAEAMAKFSLEIESAMNITHS